MHHACQDCMAFCFWHKTVACFSLFGKWTHLGNGTFQACVCLQYAWKRYCPNTPHDSCRNNNPNFFLPEEYFQEHIIRSQKCWFGGTSGVHPVLALLPALGKVSHAFSNWVFRTHSKDKDSTTTLIRLPNFPKLYPELLRTQSVAIASSATGCLPLPRNPWFCSLCNTHCHGCGLLFHHLLVSFSP